MNDMMIFNEVISNLGLIELPINGRSYTWSNTQENPLLQQLDWFFITNFWTELPRHYSQATGQMYF